MVTSRSSSTATSRSPPARCTVTGLGRPPGAPRRRRRGARASPARPGPRRLPSRSGQLGGPSPARLDVALRKALGHLIAAEPAHHGVGLGVLDDRVGVAHRDLGQLDLPPLAGQALAALAGGEARPPHADLHPSAVQHAHADGPRAGPDAPVGRQQPVGLQVAARHADSVAAVLGLAPVGFQTVMVAVPACGSASSSRIPSPPMPKFGSRGGRARAGVSSNGHVPRSTIR